MEGGVAILRAEQSQGNVVEQRFLTVLFHASHVEKVHCRIVIEWVYIVLKRKHFFSVDRCLLFQDSLVVDLCSQGYSAFYYVDLLSWH